MLFGVKVLPFLGVLACLEELVLEATPSLAMLCWSFPGVAGKTGGVLKTLQLKSKGFRV